MFMFGAAGADGQGALLQRELLCSYLPTYLGVPFFGRVWEIREREPRGGGGHFRFDMARLNAKGKLCPGKKRDWRGLTLAPGPFAFRVSNAEGERVIHTQREEKPIQKSTVPRLARRNASITDRGPKYVAGPYHCSAANASQDFVITTSNHHKWPPAGRPPGPL